MNKRQFLKTAGLAGLAATQVRLSSFASFKSSRKDAGKGRHRAWISPPFSDKEEEVRELYKAYSEAGISVLYIEDDNELHFRIAKENKIEAHRWIKTFLKDEEELLKSHPEWYAVNRKGESCVDK